MDSYFVRHTEKLTVRREDLERLWEEDRVAIHYPEYPDGLRDADNDSIEPGDYRATAKTAIGRLGELGARGGYVWTESLVSGDAKVGVVAPGTEVEVEREAWWREPDDGEGPRSGRRAVLKTLRLQDARPVRRGEAMGLRAGRPRMGTISRWRNCKTRLADLVDGRATSRVWPNLSTAQQEAACAEFLRLQGEVAGLPRLRRLLLPVGRTLEDVDIYGLDDEGREVFAQVTYLESQKAREKLDRLKEYGSAGASLVLFCRRDAPAEREDGVWFVSVEGEVMDWALSDAGYARGLWG